MDNQDEDLSKAIIKYPNFNLYSLEIRLFYVLLSPCSVETAPDHLTLRHLRREIGVSLEINGVRVPSSEIASLNLRRNRVDKESSEVTYVSTDSVRITGSVEFEVHEEIDMMLCGTVERIEAGWSSKNGIDSKTGWTMDCYTAAVESSAFFRPKLGVSSPAIEVYIAGCCLGVPVILTKTIQISPRKKVSRQGMLDAIPEDDEEMLKGQQSGNGLVRQELKQITESNIDDDEVDGKFEHSYYSEDMYSGEEGQLSWFNAGVRVGVGISLGMCVGVGIGVGLLMRSYQTTTKNMRRRFF